jgi:hypothetical protein
MLNTLKNFGSLLVFECLIVPLVALEVLGHSADIATTWYALTKTGAREGNPFLAWLLNSRWRYKWVVVSAAKAAIISNETRYYFESKRSKWARYYNFRAAVFHVTAVWLVAAWNLLIISRRKHGNTSTQET